METIGDLFHMGRMAVGAFFVLICIVYVVIRLSLGKEKTEELYTKWDRPLGGKRE